MTSPTTTPAPIEPDEILPAEPTPQPAATPTPLLVDRREHHQHLHVHVHGAANKHPVQDNAANPAGYGASLSPPLVASRRTQRATAIVFALTALAALLLAAPLAHTVFLPVPLVGVLLNTALAVRVATAPRRPTG